MKLKIRSQFIASPGMSFIALDLSQAETWIVAYLSNEPRMKHALQHSDIHTNTACAIFNSDHANCGHKWIKDDTTGSRNCQVCASTISDAERYLGKRSNHGNAYRMSAERWTQVINSDSDMPPYVTVTVAEAKRYRKTWLEFYPGVQFWWRSIESQLSDNRTLRTPYGRERVFYENWGDTLFKEATAFLPQSTVADHGFGMVQPELGITGGILGISRLPDVQRHCKIVNTSHDSVMLEVPIGSEQAIANQCYHQFRRPLVIGDETFTIPVDGEYGDRWGELAPMPKDWLN